MVVVLAMFVVLLLGWNMLRQDKVETVTTDEVADLMKTDTSIVILDVRTPEEYQSSSYNFV